MEFLSKAQIFIMKRQLHNWAACASLMLSAGHKKLRTIDLNQVSDEADISSIISDINRDYLASL